MKYARVEISPRSGSRRLVLGLREAVLLLTAGFAGLADFSGILGTPSHRLRTRAPRGQTSTRRIDPPPRDLRARNADHFRRYASRPFHGRRDVFIRRTALRREPPTCLPHRWQRCLPALSSTFASDRARNRNARRLGSDRDLLTDRGVTALAHLAPASRARAAAPSPDPYRLLRGPSDSACRGQ
jgi:hypothetical protein